MPSLVVADPTRDRLATLSETQSTYEKAPMVGLDTGAEVAPVGDTAVLVGNVVGNVPLLE